MKIWIQKKIALSIFASSILAIVFPGALAQDPVAEEEVLERLILRGTPLTNVLSLLEQLTGRSVIRPEQMPTPNITFDSQREISKEEAIIAIESLLSINGIGVSPMGDRFLEVVSIGSIKTESPELVIDSLQDRPPSGKIVSKLFRLKYLDTQTFQQQIAQFLTPNINSVVPFQNSNSVIVTDTVSNLQRVEYVVQEVDQPSRLNIETRFYTLEFAQASAVAEQMQALIDDARSRFGVQDNRAGNTGNRAGGNQRQPQTATVAPVTLPSGGSSIPEQILFGSTTAITADDRTNQLIIMTEPSNLVFFDEIISKLDIQADPNELIEVIQMDHALAVDVVSLISNFISGASQTEGSDVDLSENLQQNTRGNPNQPNNQNNARNQNRANVVENTLEERDSQFSSFMTIVADERSNSIIISGTRNDLELTREIVKKIDVLLPQVRIEVVIVDVSLDKGDTRGIDAFGFTYTQNEEAGSPNITNASVNILGLGISNASFTYDNGVISNLTLDAVLNRARTNENINLVSTPNLMTTHNREAVINVGEERPLITGVQTDLAGGTGATRSQVQYENIAIELTVTPLIGPNDVIQMEIDQVIEDVIGDVLIDGNEQPIIGTRQATSYVSVQDGKLIILGGLQQFRNSRSNSRPALIGDIPLIGKLFGSQSKDVERSELLVFIRPKVIRTTEEADDDAIENINNLSDPEKIHDFLEDGTFSSDKDRPSKKSESVVKKRIQR